MPIPRVGFKAEFYRIKFDQGRFTKEFDDRAQRLVRQAARAWLRAAIVQVPVWTGFAMGSLKFARGPNGDLAAFLNVAIPISPQSDRPKYYRHSDGSRVSKVPENAGRFSQYNFPSAQHRYRFSFRTDVFHYMLNEFYDMNPRPSFSSPWNSFQFARSAFRKYISENYQNLPKIKSYMSKGDVIKVG